MNKRYLIQLSMSLSFLLLFSCKEVSEQEATEDEQVTTEIKQVDNEYEEDQVESEYSSSETFIGEQTWMTNNLNVKVFSNGDPIKMVYTKEEWISAGRNMTPACCYYNFDSTNNKNYGLLYNWFAVNDQRGLAPSGWSIPTIEDWNLLVEYLGGINSANKKLKSKNGWADSGNGKDEFNFSALPGGICFDDGTFGTARYSGNWWTISEFDGYRAYQFSLSHTNLGKNGRNFSMNKQLGLSVRCTKFSATNNDAQSTNSNLELGENSNLIKMGNQFWMANNLNVAYFRNGDPIPQAQSNDEWQKAIENGEPAWCYYNSDNANEDQYGKLYNWYAVTDSRGLAPNGYHIPTIKEWELMINFWEEDGSALKNSSGWEVYQGKEGNGTNRSGFSALPGGSRKYDGSYNGLGTSGCWWSSTASNSGGAWRISLYSQNTNYGKGSGDKDYGFSVRCIKD